MLTIIALGDVQLMLHCMKPIISLKWVSRVRKRRWMTPHEIRAPIAVLRWWRLSMDVLQSLNSVV